MSAARRAEATPERQRELLVATMDHLKSLPADATPPVMAEAIHALVRAQTRNPDPYRAAKQEATEQALALLPALGERVRTAADPLDTAVRIAIAGNIIDYGVGETFALEATLELVLEQPYAIDGLNALRQALETTEDILFLGDNAGETVFDRVLIEHLGKPVTYVVKGSPIINDATLEDAIAAGLDQATEIIDNGSAAPGTILDRCSPELRQRFDAARLIIAKGQANYETLSEVPAPIFFLLQAKCGVIAGDLGARQGDIILKAPRDPGQV
nr:ARMT1-like domain-containing protein [Thiorhodococcus minor]